MAFLSLRKSIFRIFLLVLLLRMSALLRLRWSLMLSFVLLMVILFLIPRVIAILLGVLFILLSPVLISLILFIFRVSLSQLLPPFTTVISSVSFVIFVARSLVAFSFLVPALSSSGATWVSDSTDCRSLFAYCVFLGGSLVAWKTRKQVAVSRSSVEAELRAMALLIAEVTWLRWLLADFGVSVMTLTPILSDSTSAISIARDPVKHELTKHIGVDAFYTHAQVQDQVVALHYVLSDLQLADFFTKAQTRVQHDFLLSKLSVVDPP
uniref:Uncharacterized protein n=1 Tax=Avena sativa TaxID=4498 RepID=A0ACD5ZUS4_AVESA